MFQCKRNAQGLTNGEIDLSNKIKLRGHEIVYGDGEYVGAYVVAAALVVRAHMHTESVVSIVVQFSNTISLR
jgi:hypothetical protein